MTFEVLCAMISVVALASMLFMLEKRVQRLEKLLSQAEHTRSSDGA